MATRIIEAPLIWHEVVDEGRGKHRAFVMNHVFEASECKEKNEKTGIIIDAYSIKMDGQKVVIANARPSSVVFSYEEPMYESGLIGMSIDMISGNATGRIFSEHVNASAVEMLFKVLEPKPGDVLH